MTTFIYAGLFRLIMVTSFALERLGLTSIEAKLYIALLKIGSTTSGPLVKKTELHRATVYDVLKRLMEKGLVNFIVKEKTKYFQATAPSHLLDIVLKEKEDLEKKEEELRKAVKELEQIQELSKNKEVAQIFQGIRAVKTVYNDTLNADEILIFGSGGKFKEKVGAAFFKKYIEVRMRKKVQVRHLVSDRARGTEFDYAYYKNKLGQSKFYPAEYENPTSMLIYGDKVATIIWIETPIAFVIESKEAADAQRNHFEMVWNIAKK